MGLIPFLLLLPDPASGALTANHPSKGAGLDKVTLDGQDYYVKGDVRGEVVSEFEDGFKVGPARYDNREHVFYYTMDDFSKGFGTRRVDLDKPGYFWDSDRTNTPDLSRPGHITLGPKSEVLTLNPPPTHYDMTRNGIYNPSMPVLKYPNIASWVVGIGSRLYLTNGTTFQPLFDTNEDEITSIQSLGVNGTRQSSAIWLMSTKSGTTMYQSSGYPSYWRELDINTAGGISIVGGGGGGGGGIGVVHFGGTVAPNIQAATDLLEWDGKMLAFWKYFIYFGTGAIGSDSTSEDGSSISSVQMTWNTNINEDGTFIAVLAELTGCRWLGVAEGPWGTIVPYFIAGNNQLYALDFYARKAFKIDIGLALATFTAACQWAGKFYLSEGWNVMEYDPGSRAAMNVGFPQADGIPISLRPSGGDYIIKGFIPAEDRLYAIVCGGGATPKTHVFQMKLGHPGEWSQIGEGQQTTLFSHTGWLLTFSAEERGSGSDERLLFLSGAPAENDQGINTRLIKYTLPMTSHTPVVTRDHFAASGANWTSSWFDGGFMDIYGNGLRMFIDAQSLTGSEAVMAEYQLDNDESSPWVQMRDADNFPANFDNTHRMLYFRNAPDPVLGIQFRTIRWRFSLLRGGDDTLSPEVKAFVFVYHKKAPNRMGWTFTVDVNRMVQEQITNVRTGAVCTYRSVMESLRTSWDSQTLVYFSVPNLFSDQRVDMQKMQLGVDDFRSTSSDVLDTPNTLGQIQVTVLEPIAPRSE